MNLKMTLAALLLAPLALTACKKNEAPERKPLRHLKQQLLKKL